MNKKDILKLRRSLGMTQNAFCREYKIPKRILEMWERGDRTPDLIAKNYLRVIEAMPTTVKQIV